MEATSSSSHNLRNLEIRAGVDRVELGNFSRVLDIGGREFLSVVYSDNELRYCSDRVNRLAARFAAKEATSKVLRTGLKNFRLTDIEVLSGNSGEPRILLHREAKDLAATIGIVSISASLTHTSKVAEAFVVALVSRN